jgi:hypothetical protein
LYEALLWARYGTWPGWDLRWPLVKLDWPVPYTQWVCIESVLEWFLSWSVWGSGLFFGFILAIVGMIADVNIQFGPGSVDQEKSKRLQEKYGRKTDLP